MNPPLQHRMRMHPPRALRLLALGTVLVAATSAAHADTGAPTAPAAALEHARQDIATQVQQAVTQVHEARAQAQAKARQALEARKQYQLALLNPTADIPNLPELPEPPEPPQPPEPPVWSEFGDSIGDALSTAYGSAYGIASDIVALGSGRPAPALVVAGNIEPAELVNLQEDLNVMARILDKASDKVTGAGQTHTALGIVIQTPLAQRGPQATYLEGYGAVFTLNVRYPLVAPPPKPEKTGDNAEPDNSLWEETRAELYGGGSMKRTVVIAAKGRSGAAAEYSAERVDKLKQALFDAARNAANLRRLRPEENVVIAIQGTGHPLAKRTEFRGARTSATHRVQVTDAGTAPSSTLTIQFKKADAEALAKGTITLDEFAKKTTVAAY